MAAPAENIDKSLIVVAKGPRAGSHRLRSGAGMFNNKPLIRSLFAQTKVGYEIKNQEKENLWKAKFLPTKSFRRM